MSVDWAAVATRWLDGDERYEVAAARLYRDLVDGLSPMLGLASVGLVFARSLQLTSHRFPFVDQILTLEGTEAMSERLQLTLELQDPAAGRAASLALFGSFLRLLETYLGTTLATRLLQDIRSIEPVGGIDPA